MRVSGMQPRVAQMPLPRSTLTIQPKDRKNTKRVKHVAGALPEPSDARGAISIGLSLTDAGDYATALPYFEQALELPGTGLKRFRDKPNLISNGEKMAALYNIACCQSQMAKMAAAENDDERKEECIANGLVALAGALEAGMEDYATLRGDADLDMLRGEKFDRLTGAFEKKSRGLFGNLFQ